MRVSITILVTSLVVMSSLNRSRAQDMVDASTVRKFIYPSSHCIEHVAVDFDSLITESWMVECSENIV